MPKLDNIKASVKLEVDDSLRDLTVTERLNQIVESNSFLLKQLNKLSVNLDVAITGPRPIASDIGDDKELREMSIDKLLLNIEDQLSVFVNYIDDIESSVSKL